MGSGYGWHSSGALEYRYDLKSPSGFAGTGLMHVLPEVGYVLGDHSAVSLQVRQQIISSEGDTGGRTGRPASGAFAALARYTYSFGDPSSYMRAFVSGALGGGEGFRLVLAPNKVAGQPGTDTMRGGPVVFGPGAGLRFRLGDSFGVAIELRTLVGIPDTAAVFDVNSSVGYLF